MNLASNDESHFASIPEVLDELRAGRMIVLVDDPDRENEGDLVMAAEKVTPEAITFMARKASGLICLPMSGELIDRLGLSVMAQRNTSRHGTAFTVSIEARRGVSTGISAHDRAHTVLTAIADNATPEDLSQPGHMFPLRAQKGGVLVRTGQTEGSVDLARLAGLKPAAVICEIMNDDGSMARVPQLRAFCREHGLLMTTVAHIIEYRHAQERLIERQVTTRLPTRHGAFVIHLYQSLVDGSSHIALTMGLPEPTEPNQPLPAQQQPLLVRVHSECLTGDVFGSLRCDCGDQLDAALELIGQAQAGVLLYMRQEGRGIGLTNKLRAYQLQLDHGLDTVEANEALGLAADQRHYGIGAQILHDLGVRRLRLLTNNPRKFNALRGYGLEIIERIPLETQPNAENTHYLRTKRDKLGHLLGNV
jgi:3,4-dihydroxy 2-butanone 4-phosphate synthase/GTP cyclohydrolase II